MKTAAPVPPRVAHGVAGRELWLRDIDGRGVRSLTLDQAHQLVDAGAGYPDIAPDGTWREVRLKFALRPNSRRTFIEHSAAAAGNHGARYEHNHRACNLWTY